MVKPLDHTALLLVFCFLAELSDANPIFAIRSFNRNLKEVQFQKTTLVTSAAAPIPTPRDHAMPHRTQSGHNFALDPFGFLGGEPEETATNSVSSAAATSSAIESESSTETHESRTSSTAGTRSTAMTSSNNVLGTPGHDTVQPGWTSMSVTQTSDGNATPTEQLTPKQTTGSTSQASSGMNSWKIIGIGIVTFVGVLTLIIGFTFHDTWWDKLLRPVFLGKPDKTNGEVLIPDWKRHSWRFGIEEKEGADRYPCNPSPLKVNMTHDLQSKITLVNVDELNEKPRELADNQLSFPLPPVSPFPLRREPSTKSNSDNVYKHQEGDTSIIPSPPPVHAPNRLSLNAIGLPSALQYGTTSQDNKQGEKRKSRMSLQASRTDLGQTSSIYGGIA